MSVRMLVAIAMGSGFGVGYMFADFKAKKYGSGPEILTSQKSEGPLSKELLGEGPKLSYFEVLTKPPRRITGQKEKPDKSLSVLLDVEQNESETKGVSDTNEQLKPSRNRIAQALRRVLGKGTPSSLEEISNSDSRKYALQVASFRLKRDAEKLGLNLRKKGYEAKVIPSTVGAKQRYRVRIIGFDSTESLHQFQKQFERVENFQTLAVRY